MKFRKTLVGAALVAASLAGLAIAQPVITQVQQINANDLFQDIPNGIPSAQNVYASAALLGNYSPTLGGNNPENILIGGDATTNLFQRGTTGSSVTTTITYGGPDRWAYWSGTSTAMTVSQDTTAADLPSSSFKAAFKMARTSGQTGVVQVCMMQEVETANAYTLQGQTAEIDFHAVAGANFSAASSNLVVVLITGTGTDEGVSKAAFNYNAGGGGSSTWAGQINTALTVPISTVAARYTVAAPVPATATEVAVAICFTPVGTAGTNDYVALSGIQLTRNSSLTTVAGTAGIVLTNDARAKSFSRRSQALETVLQQRYYYQITESSTVIGVRATCGVSTSSVMNCMIPFPVTMRIAPTMSYATGFEASTTGASTAATACTSLATSTSLTGNAATNFNVLMTCASSAAFGSVGTVGYLWDVGTGSPSGAIKASAEF